MTCIFECQPLKTKPKLQAKRVMKGFQVYTYVYIYIYTSIRIYLEGLEMSQPEPLPPQKKSKTKILIFELQSFPIQSMGRLYIYQINLSEMQKKVDNRPMDPYLVAHGS